MKNNIIKLLIFIISFVLSLIIISTIVNKKNTDMTADMSPAILPLVRIADGSGLINTMHGYTDEMDARYLRDTLTPLSTDRKVTLKIQLWDNKVEGLTYEVRSLDTQRLVEKTENYDFVNNGDEATAIFELKDLIESDQEYLLIVTLDMEKGPEASYYTRIIASDQLPVTQQLDFVRNFHEKTFDRVAAKELSTYLESNEQGDNSSFAHVDIHSSFNQITWGNLDIRDRESENLNIYEMDSDIASMGMDYNLSIDNEGSTEYYRVHEFYRARYTTERIYLLDYDRTMEQIFDPEGDSFINDKIMLGITNKDHEIYESTDGSIVLFNQQNCLYEYRIEEGKLARIFSFYDDKNKDERCFYDQHTIRVLNVDENGNVLFLVYGYMDRGSHEGRVGVSVLYYNNAQNCIEEQVYIPYDKSYGILKEELSRLTYHNRKNELFLYLDNNIYSIRLDGGDGQVLVQGLTIDKLISSRDCQLISWDDEDSSSITLMDLSSGNMRTIDSEGGDGIDALGFLGDDIVYGLYDRNDIVRDATGLVYNPMYSIRIEDKNGTLLKEYREDDIYVTDVTLSDAAIFMNRIRKQGDSYTAISSDQILHNEEKESSRNQITQAVTPDRETVTEIALISNVTSNIYMQTPKFVLTEGIRNFNLKENDREHECYYVYAGGGLKGIFTQAVSAVLNASENNGVVVDDSQYYIWKKGNRKQHTEIKEIKLEGAATGEEGSYENLALCLDAILVYEQSPRNSLYELEHGENAISLLEKNIDGRVLRLNGCSLSDILYYVSQNKPVLAVGDNALPVLIIGYDEKNVIILDPATGSRYKKGMNDSAKMFSDNGNEFICYGD